jgi:hypothetical protein
LKDKKLWIEARKPFFILEKSKSDEEPETEPIEPENTSLPYRQKEATASLCPRLLGDLHDVRTLRHRNEYLVKSIYHFFQSFKNSPYEIFPDWSNRDHGVN